MDTKQIEILQDRISSQSEEITRLMAENAVLKGNLERERETSECYRRRSIQNSALYDRTLKLYKLSLQVNVELASMLKEQRE